MPEEGPVRARIRNPGGVPWDGLFASGCRVLEKQQVRRNRMQDRAQTHGLGVETQSLESGFPGVAMPGGQGKAGAWAWSGRGARLEGRPSAGFS